MIDDAATFLEQFGSRTLSYLPGFEDDGRPVVIVLGERAHSPAGHALATSLVNQLSRLFRSVAVVGDIDRELLCRSIFGHRTVRGAALGLATEINPFISVAHELSVPTNRLLSIGIGTDDSDLPVGCEGWVASIGRGSSVDPEPWGIWGAQLAACLAANAAVHRALGDTSLPRGTWSLWEFGAPLRTRQGPADFSVLDVGRVLAAGLGAVGAALTYSLGHIDVRGQWVLADHDTVDITNLNRQLIFLARHAGWLETPWLKVARAGECFPPGVATASDQIYGRDPLVVEREYDVVLALANEHGARSLLQGRQPTVLLHATTSPNWQAQLHRHIAGRDDCVPCRLPEHVRSAFACSTATAATQQDGARHDASLPQLSALAGLLLATALVRLQVGELATLDHNSFHVKLDAPDPIAGRVVQSCRQSCTSRLPASARADLEAHGRYRSLDRDVARLQHGVSGTPIELAKASGDSDAPGSDAKIGASESHQSTQ